MQKIMVFLLAAMLFGSYFLPDSFATSLKKSDEIRCTNIYPKFLIMGEDGFQKRYPAYPIMDKCMMLFKDPNFIEKNNFNQKKSKISEVSSNAKILTVIKIGQEKFLTKFNMCYNENQKTKYIQIITDKEEIVGKSFRLHNEMCPSFWIEIYANDPQKTLFSWDYEHKYNHKIERKML
ncbi:MULTISPECIES: hypothetical protein [Nitrosopumilus]|uniref:Uncharacterized protein n=1 Tax=Nitrosopumilus piranensis TaxID=1582439 RepID=A0A0C5BYD8_9ARCH|nr:MULTISPECIES: hypothetical protein [Nitrosopumilus]AJM91980.1 conserved exported protein of unknown function [Nitrosopumilus piranensis]KAF6245181.1 hypothetical protein C6989_04420 [Nitrosopumilus sp. b2]